MQFRAFFAASFVMGFAACSQDEPPAPAAAEPDTALPADGLRLPLPAGTSPAVTAEDLGVRIAALADDSFEGRAPGSEAGEASADWIAAELERVGVSPAGSDGTWFQTVEMVEQTIDETQSGLTFSGGASGRDYRLKLGDEAVIWTKRQAEPSLAFEGADVVFVGYGVVAPEYGWDDYAGLDARGKTVVMLVNDPGFATEDPDLFRGKAMTYYGRWTYKFEEAARQGAAAAIIVHETEPASYGWEVVEGSWSGAQADLVRADAGAERAQIEGWIQIDAARKVFAEAGLDFEAMKDAAKTPGFSPIAMGGLKASGAIAQNVERRQSRNVVGRIEGRTAPDEYVLYTAHWDHLGKKSGEKAGEPGQDFYRDEIFNGAVDNATGSAALIEVAEAMAAEELDRSALFIAVTLEESGLLGSAYYAANPTVPLSRIVAGVNMDGMLPTGRTRDMVVVGYGASELEDKLAAIVAEQGRVIKPDPNPQAGYFYRSDHISFAKEGVPMLYADGGEDRLDGGLAAGKAFADVYTAQRYHKPADEYSADWDLSGMEEDITALFRVGLELAQSDDWPEWYDGNEFKAIREASLAGGN